MKIIHICNNYVSSKVHANLILSMSKKLRQSVIIPCRNASHIGINKVIDEKVHCRYFKYPNILRFFPVIKLVYFAIRIFSLLKVDFTKKYQMQFLAHNMWSDGIPLYFLSLFFPLKYSLVVRSSEINFFLPKLPHYRWLVKKMIANSEGLIFVSSAHFDRFKTQYPGLFEAANKAIVIPNGIDGYWLDNTIKKKHNKKSNSLCFVGKFDRNKNIQGIYKASLIAKQNFPDIEVTFLGGDADSFLELTELQRIPDWLHIIPRTNQKKDIQLLFENSEIFIMPSFTETFGLVYFEALSQGCALICSKGEGIDGFLSRDYVFSVNPRDSQNIASAIEEILSAKHFPTVQNIVEDLNRVNWDGIAIQYYEQMNL